VFQFHLCNGGERVRARQEISGANDPAIESDKRNKDAVDRHRGSADPVISFSVIAWPKSAALRLSFLLGRLGGFAANFFHHNHWI
jgi:hypothetical protein